MRPVGISSWAFVGGVRGRKDPLAAITEAAAAGFAAIELSLSRRGYLALEQPRADPAAIRRCARDHLVEIDSVTTLLLYECRLLADDAAEQAAALAIVRTMLQLATAVGAPRVSLPLIGAASRLPRLLPELRRLLAAQPAARVRLCIENVRADPFADPADLDPVLDALPAEQSGLCLDIGNTLPHSSPEAWIKHHAGQIAKVHLTEFRRGPDGEALSVDVGEGELSWPPVLQALDRAGYHGPLIVEAFPRPGERDGARLARLRRAVDGLAG